jgi:2-polyprenyl-6-methoxyphenol hydroxylase-like FAD-dependent oxidoreductase
VDKENIAIVGAGICGLCTALALGSKGHRVTVYERDIPPPEGGAEEAFFNWKRRGAAQFRHPHAFLSVMCNLLEERYPDLVGEFWRAGARKMTFTDTLPPELAATYVPEPGDEKMWLLMCRRATMETVLRRYVENTHGITIANNTSVIGITTEERDEAQAITGLELRTSEGDIETIHPNLIVDASGRTTKFPEWFEKRGCTFGVEDDDAEIVYYTRHYRLHPGEDEPPRHGEARSAGDLGYIKYGIFPADNGHFAAILCIPNHEEELREAVKDADGFQQICLTIPGIEPWVNESKSTPTTHPFGFGDIHAVWRHYVKDGRPQALNYFAVGDAAIRTNPLYGRGCSTGIMHAHLLAELLDEISDPAERALRFNEKTEEILRPIFKASLSDDKRGILRAKSIFEGNQLDEASTLRGWLRAAFLDAVAAAAREHIHVVRGALRTFNLMEKPGDFLKDRRVQWIVLRYLLRGRGRNAESRLQPGPSRLEMLAVLKDTAGG